MFNLILSLALKKYKAKMQDTGRMIQTAIADEVNKKKNPINIRIQTSMRPFNLVISVSAPKKKHRK